jgi:hypothetical protein
MSPAHSCQKMRTGEYTSEQYHFTPPEYTHTVLLITEIALGSGMAVLRGSGCDSGHPEARLIGLG